MIFMRMGAYKIIYIFDTERGQLIGNINAVAAVAGVYEHDRAVREHKQRTVSLTHVKEICGQMVAFGNVIFAAAARERREGQNDSNDK